MAKPLKTCQRCPLFEEPFVQPENLGLVDPRGIMVAEAPGKEEVQQKRPLIGTAGRLLRRMYPDSLVDYVLMNTVQCRPPKNRKPTPREIKWCRKYINTLLEERANVPLILLGDTAGKAFIDLKGPIQVTKNRGYIYQTNSDFCKNAFLTFHPSFISRSQWYAPITVKIYEHDLRRAMMWVRGEFEHTAESTNYNVTESANDLELFLYNADPYANITAVDIETSGLNAKKDHIIGIAFSSAQGHAVSVQWPEHDDGMYETIKQFMEDRDARKVFQNGLFDIAFLREAGITTNGYIADTMYGHHFTVPDAPPTIKPNSLQFLTSIYTDLPNYKYKYRAFYEGEKVPMGAIQKLACYDVDSTRQIWMKVQREHQQLKLSEYFHEVAMPIVPTLDYMHGMGVKIDEQYLHSLEDRLRPRMEELEAAYPINLRSSKQKVDFLLSEGFGLSKKTQTGAYAVDAEVMNDLLQREKDDDKALILRDFAEYMDSYKTVNTYCKGLFKRITNGRLHTSFGFGTSTGRLSSRDPNLQNIPSIVRPAFIPDRDDQLWVKADYDQLELYVAALEYEEATLLNDLTGGVDVHDKAQQAAFGYAYDKNDKSQRTKIKSVVFGTLYGRSSRAIAIQFGVPLEEAKQWQYALFNLYPKIHSGQERHVKEARADGMIRTAFGNFRATTEFTKVVNHPIQGGAAGVLNQALSRVRRETALDPRLTVHDEIDFIVPMAHKATDTLFIENIMSSEVEQYDDFKFPVSIEVGPSWGDVS